MDDYSLIDLCFYLFLVGIVAFKFWHFGRVNAYEEIAIASGVDTKELMDEVASIQEKK